MTRVPILYLVNDFQVGSSNRRILNLVENLDHDRYAVHVGCTKRVGGPLAAPFSATGARTVNFAVRSGSGGCLWSVLRYIRHHQIRIVHSQVLRSDLVGGCAARLTHGVLAVSTKCNSFFVRDQPGWWLRNPPYLSAMYLPDRIVTVSEALRQEILGRVRRHPEHIVTIHTGIRASDFDKPERRNVCRRDLGIADDEPAIGYLGRMTGGKGLNDLLAATCRVLNEHPRCRLVLVGDGDQRPSLARMAGDLGIAPRVLFTGFRSDIPDILAALDLVVLPSLTEGLPQSLLEAMAAGKAVVATPVGGVCEIVQPDVNGFIARERDPAHLAAVISNVVARPDLRATVGQRARARVRQHFDIARMVAVYDAFYRSNLTGTYLDAVS